jgi:hypothetical protein
LFCRVAVSLAPHHHYLEVPEALHPENLIHTTGVREAEVDRQEHIDLHRCQVREEAEEEELTDRDHDRQAVTLEAVEVVEEEADEEAEGEVETTMEDTARSAQTPDLGPDLPGAVALDHTRRVRARVRFQELLQGGPAEVVVAEGGSLLREGDVEVKIEGEVVVVEGAQAMILITVIAIAVVVEIAGGMDGIGGRNCNS